MLSYYLLPKKNNTIQIKPSRTINSINPIKPVISYSLMYYLNDALNNLFTNEEEERNNIKKILNPYEFIFTKIPDSNISISKLNPHSNIFYIVIEIINIFNLLDLFIGKNITSICYSFFYKSVIDCLQMFRNNNNYKDNHIIGDLNDLFNEIYTDVNKYPNIIGALSIDFLFYELQDDVYIDIHKYSQGLTSILHNILIHQAENGACIIKINNIFYKPILDIVFILTSLYDKVYIIKPNASDIMSNDRFIICKKFTKNPLMIQEYLFHLDSLKRSRMEWNQIHSLIDEDIPYYFINKIEESNITIGHQQIEAFDQMMGIMKNKNKEDKLTALKKNNIQKCILWCEKNKISCNKFFENNGNSNSNSNNSNNSSNNSSNGNGNSNSNKNIFL